MSGTILYEVKDRIAYVTLNRPDQMNALNRELLKRWAEVIETFNSDPEPLVAIVTGAGGRAFSVGMDLKERASRDTSGDPKTARAPRAPKLFEKPAIAAIQGYCVAGGLEISLQCDIRIATPNSQFGLPEPRWSLTAGYGLHNLNRMVPLGEALYMQLTGERIGAERAYQIGLVQQIVPPEQLMPRAKQIADSVLMCAPLAVRAIKKVVMDARDRPLEESWKLAAELTAGLTSSEDFREGPRAFAEKRKPQWKGR
ncbi:MAG: enoyl-CoA hydratase/isomerase family protein [Chloroflexi bacterium]|nr:enoyl-CoA hydratase/isomerase family protein [Chloroflexota bacterium]